MSRKILSLVLAAGLVAGSFGSAYAQDTDAKGAERAAAPVSLSLAAATEKMQEDGPGAEVAALNLRAAQATARGYRESTDNMSEMLDKYKALGIISSAIPTESDVNLIRLQREFALTQGPLNFEAEMNALKTETVRNYFGVLQTQDVVKIQQENLAVQERLLANTQLRFELGMVAKQAVLQAEIAVMSARDGLTAAQNAYQLASMGFNRFLGYSALQPLILTDKLAAVPMPALTVDEAVAKGLKERNEIKAAAFGGKIQEVLFNRIKVRYPSSSATYLKQQVAALNAQAYYDSAVTGIEIDIRSKYQAMTQAKEAIDTGTASVSKARELLRIAELSFNVGINTITEVQQAQILVLSEELGLSQAILAYDLAVYDFEIAAGTGTFSAPL